MNHDPFERDLRSVIHEMSPEKVPDSLRIRVAEVPLTRGRNRLASAFVRARSLANAAALVAVVAVAVVVVLSTRPGTGQTPGGPPAASSTPESTPSATAAPTSTPAPTATASPSATPLAVTPQPGDEAAATSLASRYETALIHRDWQSAWDLLAPEQQAHWSSYASFVSERSAFFKSADGSFEAKAPTHDAASLAQWVRPDFPTTANLDRAFLIEIDFPALAGNSAGWEMLLVAPDASGRWLIWQVR